jgi:hypothetical protein
MNFILLAKYSMARLDPFEKSFGRKKNKSKELKEIIFLY